MVPLTFNLGFFCVCWHTFSNLFVQKTIVVIWHMSKRKRFFWLAKEKTSYLRTPKIFKKSFVNFWVVNIKFLNSKIGGLCCSWRVLHFSTHSEITVIYTFKMCCFQFLSWILSPFWKDRKISYLERATNIKKYVQGDTEYLYDGERSLFAH